MKNSNRVGVTRAGQASRLVLLAFLVFLLFPSYGMGEGSPDLTALSLEELMDVEVTSVAKKSQRLSDAAAAVFVITPEDIRRSGVTTIAEALRMVPGLQVAKMDANKWAISSRGFNGGYSNKLLVLMDGRSIYTPLFSGVHWRLQDTMLEDLDRIEVIRGPGATLWGANAVNGVINIITKSAEDTQGGLVTTGGGTEEQGFAGMRYGGKSAEDTRYRVYVKFADHDDAVYASGDDAADEWRSIQGGFRIDRKIRARDTLTLQGDIVDIKSGDRVALATPPASIQTSDQSIYLSGMNLLGRWKRSLSDEEDFTLQIYYDRTNWDTVLLDEIRDTFDVDFYHRFSWGENHGIVWGIGYRFIQDDIDNTVYVAFSPDRRHDHLWSGFVQDDICLLKDRLCFTLGSKFEHNDYTGFEIQPNARLIWHPNRTSSIWAAVSRAVRTPSRGEHDARLNTTHPALGSMVLPVLGQDGFESEDLVAYELGCRVLPLDQLSLDMAVFFNRYNNLRTYEFMLTHFEVDNMMTANAYGLELALDWKVLDWWRIQAAYAYHRMQLHLDNDSRDMISEDEEGVNPHHQISLRSSMDLTENLELDLWGRYVDHLPSQAVGSYVSLDVRLGWRPGKNLELSLVGQNLLDSQHPEFVPELIQTWPTEVEHSVYGKITWYF